MSWVVSPELENFAKQSMESRCVSCRFWCPFEDPSYGLDDKEWETHCRVFTNAGHEVGTRGISYGGWCRRRAPIVVQGQDPDVPHWPLLGWDHWCGEYEDNGYTTMPFVRGVYE